MVSARVVLSAQGATELHKLGKRLKEAGRDDLRRKMRKHIRQAGKPVVADMKRAVLGVNVTRGDDPYRRRTEETGIAPRRSTDRWGPRTTGLRARTGHALGISQTRKGIRILVSAQRFGDYGLTLPRYLDGSLRNFRRWRHPVFGNREVWVTQHGDPWFFVTFNRHRTRFINAVDDGIKEMLRELEQ